MTATATLTPRTNPIAAGEIAPDFTLKDQDKNEWTLSAALEEGDVVLCFYPMAFSGVCSTEMKCVTDDFAKFEKAGATVVGISTDSFFANKAWREQLGLKQTLLADMHRQVCKAYGFYFPDLNVSSRGTVIISGDPANRGKVKWVQARELPNAMALDDVLAAIS
ncbi:MAG: redoxin domain-containing protein [Phycisphaerales bacterium]|nr:redoxin domain-containing protein [Phycisphaerales bacterium]